MLSFLFYFFLCAVGLFFSTYLLSSLGEAWLIFGLILGGSMLAGLRVLWEKLDGVEKKLDKLLKQKKEE